MIDLVAICESCGSTTVCDKCSGATKSEPWVLVEAGCILTYDCEPSCLAMPKSWVPEGDDWHPDSVSDDMPEGEARAAADIILAPKVFKVTDIEQLYHDVNLVFTLVDEGYLSSEHAMQCFQLGSGQGGPYASNPMLLFSCGHHMGSSWPPVGLLGLSE